MMESIPPITILLVDDEQRNLDALEAILDDPGYRLLRATDADKALHLLLDNDIAAIVLDIKMPGVSGFELAKMIKGTKRFRQIPILFLTAYLVDDQDVLAGYGAGAVDYLTKPVNPQILRHKIAVFADLFRKTRALAELNDTLERRVQERTSELEASEAALRAASAQKDAFLATLAHELRNPLAPIRTGIDLLLELQSQPPAVERTLAAMNRQITHMVRLIDDLLDVSRISRGMLELRKERVDLREIIDAAIEITRPFLDRRKQTVDVRRSGTAFGSFDRTRIAQIIGNLIHNAAKYSDAGARIEILVEAKGTLGIVRVIDRGVGIPADQIERVFDMFAKIKRSSPHANEGLGIGLALARQLAHLHGGTLMATSEGEGRGATLTLELPVDLSQSANSAVKAAATAASAGIRIVLIEDNRDAADILAMHLEGMGHHVQVAYTGPDGVELVREARPQLVFCDIGLPGMDGVEVCRAVGQLDLPQRPVMVALTGWGMESDRKRTKEVGFDHHLVKPVATAQLRDILHAVSTPG